MKKKKYFYWWRGINGYSNFGDEANVYLMKKLFDIDIQFKYPITLTLDLFVKIIKRRKLCSFIFDNLLYPWQKYYLSIGSILRFSNKKCIIWGSGFMTFHEDLKGGAFRAVRGELSAQKLKKSGYDISNTALGDPALLLPIVYNKKIKKNNIGIIPHHTETEYFIAKYAEKYLIIDLRTNNIEKVINQILSCSYILSTSLHGIITPQAYDIPAIWIKMGNADTDGFKFYDYFTSVGIEPYEGLENFEELLINKSNIIDFFELNKEFSKINKPLLSIQQALLKVAPFYLTNKNARSILNI